MGIDFIVNMNSESFTDKIDPIAPFAISVWAIYVYLKKCLKDDLKSFLRFRVN